MEKALPYVAGMQLPGGGFKDYPDSAHSVFGWQQCAVQAGEADPNSDYFRTFSLALISEVVPHTGMERLPLKHHHSYGHGVRPRHLL